MAKNIFSVRPAGIRERALQLEELRNQHLELMRQLRVLILGLSDSWKGAAQEALVQKFLSHGQIFSDFSNTMEEYIELALAASAEGEEIDRTLLSEVRRINL